MTAPDTVLHRVCAWCGRHLGTKPGHGATGITGSICDPCAEDFEAEDTPPEDAELALALDRIEVGEELDLSRFRRVIPIRVEDEDR